MRASKQEQTGGAGLSAVMVNLQQLGWGPAENSTHDLGTDLWVQVRDERLFDRGVLLGVQVKAGRSYFEDAVRDGDNLIGWWYSESDKRHFDYWLDHRVPHLLVLHDLDLNVSYWVLLTPDRVVDTGKGAKILVPSEQRVDNDGLPALLNAATQPTRAPIGEGSSFARTVEEIAPGARTRFALLAPRLIAPHRNRTYEHALTGVEGVALAAQARWLDWVHSAGRHEEVPSPEEVGPQHEWSWRFARELAVWMRTGAHSGYDDLLLSAPDRPSRAALTVLEACALQREEAFGSALTILTREIDADYLPPIDHAWLLVQRARIRAEIEERTAAIGDANEALTALRGETFDVTAKSLASAAEWTLQTTVPFEERDLDRYMTASDTLANWWRTQRTSGALRDASRSALASWAETPTPAVSWTRETIDDQLLAAEVSADFAGEQGAWRESLSLRAQQCLMEADGGEHTNSADWAVEALRRSGDDSSLQLAIRRLRLVGPCSALATAANRTITRRTTRTSIRTTLQMLELCGDLVSPQTAADMMLSLAHSLSEEESCVVGGVKSSYDQRVRASAGLIAAVPAEHHREVAECLARAGMPEMVYLGHPMAVIFDHMDLRETPGSLKESLLAMVRSEPGRIRASAVAALVRSGHQPAGDELHRLLADGDLDALAAVEDISALPIAVVEGLTTELVREVEKIVERAEQSSYSLGHTVLGALTAISCHFPDHDRWDLIQRALAHPKVVGWHKRPAWRAVFELCELVPPERLRGLIADLDDSTVTLKSAQGGGVGAPGVLLRSVTSELTAEQLDAELIRLAKGEPEERIDALQVLRSGRSDQHSLLALLLADPDPGVRKAAAFTVGALAGECAPVARSLADLIAADPGVAIPFALVKGVASRAGDGGLCLQWAEDHPSAYVRDEAVRIDSLSSTSD